MPVENQQELFFNAMILLLVGCYFPHLCSVIFLDCFDDMKRPKGTTCRFLWFESPKCFMETSLGKLNKVLLLCL